MYYINSNIAYIIYILIVNIDLKLNKYYLFFFKSRNRTLFFM